MQAHHSQPVKLEVYAAETGDTKTLSFKDDWPKWDVLCDYLNNAFPWLPARFIIQVHSNSVLIPVLSQRDWELAIRSCKLLPSNTMCATIPQLNLELPKADQNFNVAPPCLQRLPQGGGTEEELHFCMAYNTAKTEKYMTQAQDVMEELSRKIMALRTVITNLDSHRELLSRKMHNFDRESSDTLLRAKAFLRHAAVDRMIAKIEVGIEHIIDNGSEEEEDLTSYDPLDTLCVEKPQDYLPWGPLDSSLYDSSIFASRLDDDEEPLEFVGLQEGSLCLEEPLQTDIEAFLVKRKRLEEAEDSAVTTVVNSDSESEDSYPSDWYTDDDIEAGDVSLEELQKASLAPLDVYSEQDSVLDEGDDSNFGVMSDYFGTSSRSSSDFGSQNTKTTTRNPDYFESEVYEHKQSAEDYVESGKDDLPELIESDINDPDEVQMNDHEQETVAVAIDLEETPVVETEMIDIMEPQETPIWRVAWPVDQKVEWFKPEIDLDASNYMDDLESYAEQQAPIEPVGEDKIQNRAIIPVTSLLDQAAAALHISGGLLDAPKKPGIFSFFSSIFEPKGANGKVNVQNTQQFDTLAELAKHAHMQAQIQHVVEAPAVVDREPIVDIHPVVESEPIVEIQNNVNNQPEEYSSYPPAQPSLYASSMQLLNEMGWNNEFKNRDLLGKHEGDVSEVIRELLDMH